VIRDPGLGHPKLADACLCTADEPRVF